MVEKEQLITMVQGMQAGDEAATALMYETFHEDFYYFILKTVNNDRELAEDLLQDTFLEILETIHKLEEPVAFVTWAKQIAYHKCTGYFRKKKELLLDENEDGNNAFDIQVEENAEFIPDEALDNKELKQTIMDMINELPEEQRAALLLRYFNEVSVQEIAQIQNVSEGTVKSRLNYARKSIRQAVENYEKKNGVKLRCVGILPLLLWLFREYRLANKLSMAVGTATQTFALAEETAAVAGIAATGGGAAAGAATTTAATTATTTAATTATTTAAAVVTKSAAAVGIKAAATALTTKIVAGVAAAAIVVGGTAAGITVAKKQNAQRQPIPEAAIVQDVEEAEDTEETTTVETVLEDETTAATTEATEKTESTEETTESTECDHEWELAGVPEDAEYASLAVYKCMKCDMIKEEEPSGCDHQWDVEHMRDMGMVRYRCSVCERCYLFGDDMEEAPADVPAGCEHQWDVDNVGEDGFVLYRCVICDAVKSEELTDVPAETPEDSDACEHQWEVDNVGEDGFALYRCVICDAVKSEELTDAPADPATCDHMNGWTSSMIADGLFLYECFDCGELIETTECLHETSVESMTELPDGKYETVERCWICNATVVYVGDLVFAGDEDSCQHPEYTTSVTYHEDGVTYTKTMTCTVCGAIGEQITYSGE